jgi:hypothetical protein
MRRFHFGEASPHNSPHGLVVAGVATRGRSSDRGRCLSTHESKGEVPDVGGEEKLEEKEAMKEGTRFHRRQRGKRRWSSVSSRLSENGGRKEGGGPL